MGSDPRTAASLGRVLCIEDDPDVATVLQYGVKRAGASEVYLAADGHKGIHMATELRPDLILCDLMLPGMDGIAVVQRIHAVPGLETIPVVFITAYGPMAFRDRTAQECGALGYLSKPFRVQTVGKELLEILQRGTASAT